MRQLLTALWWECRHEWDCVVSATVMMEIAEGDVDAAAQRLELARSLGKVPSSPEVGVLSDLLIASKLVPESVKADAIHLATAAVNGAHFLATWNQKHLNNPDLRFRISELIRKQGWQPVRVVTPAQLLEEFT